MKDLQVGRFYHQNLALKYMYRSWENIRHITFLSPDKLI